MTLTLAGPTKATAVTFQDDLTGFNTAVAGIAGIDPEDIDFESFTGGDIIVSGSTHFGVTFTRSLFPGFELAIRDIGGTSGTNTLGSSNDGGSSVTRFSAGEVIDFTFSEATNAFGFFVLVTPDFAFIADDVKLSAAGTFIKNPLGFATRNCGGICDALFLGIVDDMTTFTTASVQFGPTPGAFSTPFFELDDLRFTTPSGGDDGGDDGGQDVPEPGTLAIFGFGLLGLGLARRRRKRA